MTELTASALLDPTQWYLSQLASGVDGLRHWVHIHTGERVNPEIARLILGWKRECIQCAGPSTLYTVDGMNYHSTCMCCGHRFQTTESHEDRRSRQVFGRSNLWAALRYYPVQEDDTLVRLSRRATGSSLGRYFSSGWNHTELRVLLDRTKERFEVPLGDDAVLYSSYRDYRPDVRRQPASPIGGNPNLYDGGTS